jgi:hemerythrin-like domain-containing protein
MQMYLYVHDAILREVAYFETAARELNRDSADEVADFADRMSSFHGITKTHEATEEEVLFPALEARYRFVAESYEFDHNDYDSHVFGGIDRAIAGLTHAESNGERRDGGELLHRQAVALHEHMRLHVAKENELLLPKLEAEFDLAEQVELAGAMAGMVEPPLMAQLVGWMYRGQTTQDREGMIRFLMQALPAEPLRAMTGMLAGIDAEAWEEMHRRIPELEGTDG